MLGFFPLPAKVVKGYLKEADSIWIVSNINRAVNDKTAKVKDPRRIPRILSVRLQFVRVVTACRGMLGLV